VNPFAARKSGILVWIPFGCFCATLSVQIRPNPPIYPTEPKQREELNAEVDNYANYYRDQHLKCLANPSFPTDHPNAMEVEETAQVLGISPKAAKREWSMARAWRHEDLKRGHGNPTTQLGES
jgi:hypothetical protein